MSPARPPHRVGTARPPHRVSPARPPHRVGTARPPHRVSTARPPHRVSPARPPHRVGTARPPHRTQPLPQWQADTQAKRPARSEEHTSELQSLMRISYAVSCLKKKKKN